MIYKKKQLVVILKNIRRISTRLVCLYAILNSLNYLDDSKSLPAIRDYFVTANWFWTQLLEQNNVRRQRCPTSLISLLSWIPAGSDVTRQSLSDIEQRSLALKTARKYFRHASRELARVCEDASILATAHF